MTIHDIRFVASATTGSSHFHRAQFISIGSSRSILKSIKHGVSQGSVFGIFLLLLYRNSCEKFNFEYFQEYCISLFLNQRWPQNFSLLFFLLFNLHEALKPNFANIMIISLACAGTNLVLVWVSCSCQQILNHTWF